MFFFYALDNILHFITKVAGRRLTNKQMAVATLQNRSFFVAAKNKLTP